MLTVPNAIVRADNWFVFSVADLVKACNHRADEVRSKSKSAKLVLKNFHSKSIYEEYEKNKVRENALAWLAEAERDVEMLKQAYTQATKFVSNSEGVTENWSAKMTPQEFEETIEKQFIKFKENFLKNLNKETNEDNSEN